MREDDVRGAVLKWVSSLSPTSIVHAENMGIEVYDVVDGYSIGYRMAYHIRISCSSELTEYYRGLGQCLTCCVESGFVPTYLAVPHDYPNIGRLERTVNFMKLPIGLLTVDQNGEVRIAVKPHLP